MSEPARTPCRCAAFDADREYVDGLICTCGHTVEEHGAGFLRSCEAEESEDYAEGRKEESERWRAIFCEAHDPTPPPEIPRYCPRCLGDSEGFAAGKAEQL